MRVGPARRSCPTRMTLPNFACRERPPEMTVEVHPDRHRQFGARNPEFCLVTDYGNSHAVELRPSLYYGRVSHCALEPGETLEDFLSSRAPHLADILVLAPGVFLSSPAPDVIGPNRKLSVFPCASTPVTPEQLAYFVEVCERTPHDAILARCDAAIDAVEAADSVDILDRRHGTSATLRDLSDYVWNVQAGTLTGGQQQIAPNGELSATPLDIMEFSEDRRLELNGELTLSGTPIVHRSENTDDISGQAALYERFATLVDDPVSLSIENGTIVEVRPHAQTSKPATEALEGLFGEDRRYQVIWEFGLGLNDLISPVAGNCGLNEVCGGRGMLLHIGLGLTPLMRFALTFQCRSSSVRAESMELATPFPRRTLIRQRRSTCGCDEGARA